MVDTVLAPMKDRLWRAKEILEQKKVDVLLAAPSADLQYLAGYGGHPSDRPTLLAILPGAASIMLIAEIEAPRLSSLPDTTIVTYQDTDDPFALLHSGLGHLASGPRIAISEQAWAGVLLSLQSIFPRAEFVSATPLLRELRMRKAADELERLEKAAHLTDAAFEQLVGRAFAGRTEAEVAADLSRLLQDQGLMKASWGPTVASGPHSASPHHFTGERVIQEGDAVVLDFGGVLEGYQSDITRTVHVGSPGDEYRRVYEAVQAAQEAGVQAVRPGVPAQSVDRAARRVISEAGYGQFFIHRTGHGIGLDTHEEPYILEANDLPLEPGMTFSVEPGIYLPGKFGVRIEDIVAVTGDGVRRLNRATRDLLIVH